MKSLPPLSLRAGRMLFSAEDVRTLAGANAGVALGDDFTISIVSNAERQQTLLSTLGRSVRRGCERCGVEPVLVLGDPRHPGVVAGFLGFSTRFGRSAETGLPFYDVSVDDLVLNGSLDTTGYAEVLVAGLCRVVVDDFRMMASASGYERLSVVDFQYCAPAKADLPREAAALIAERLRTVFHRLVPAVYPNLTPCIGALDIAA